MSDETIKPAIPQVPTQVNPFSLTPDQLRAKIKNDQQYAAATNPIEQNQQRYAPEIKRTMLVIPSPVQDPMQSSLNAFYDFLTAMKENIEIANGVRGNPDDRFITLRELNTAMVDLNHTIDTAVATGDSTAPDPPTGFSVTNYAFYNVLAFTFPADTDLSHVEIYCSVDSDARASSFSIGTVAGPPSGTAEWRHDGISLRHSYNYWIRAVDNSGNRSTWNPNDTVGEQIAAWTKGTINELLDELMDEDYYHSTFEIIADSFMIKQPLAALTAWLTGTNYVMFDIRKHDGSGTMKGYKCIHTHTSGASTEPGAGVDWEDEWEEITAGDLTSINVFTMGIIDSNPALGIRGDMIVDGTIIARHIDSGSIEADHITADAITATHINGGAFGNLTISSGTVTIQTSNGLNISGGGNIYIAPGSDITMDATTGAWDTSTAEIKFTVSTGGGENLRFGSDYDSAGICLYPDTQYTGSFVVGYYDADASPHSRSLSKILMLGESLVDFRLEDSATSYESYVKMVVNQTDIVAAYDNYASDYYRSYITLYSDADYQIVKIVADYNETYPAMIQVYSSSGGNSYITVDGVEFGPERDTVTTLGSAGYNWSQTYTGNISYSSTLKLDFTTSGEVKTSQNFISTTTNTIGKSGTPWSTAYITTANITTANITTANITNLGLTDIIPPADVTYDLGSSTYQWKDIHVRGIKYSGVAQIDFSGSVYITCYRDFLPQADAATTPLDIGASALRWDNIYGVVGNFSNIYQSTNIQFALSSATIYCYRDFLPNPDNTLNLGSSTSQWKRLYLRDYVYGYSGSPKFGFQSSTRVWAADDIDPDAGATHSLGDSTYYWSSLYVDQIRWKGTGTFDAYDDIKLIRSFKNKKDHEGKEIINEIGTTVLDNSSLPHFLTNRKDIADIASKASGLEITEQDIEDILTDKKQSISFVMADRDGLPGVKQGETFTVTKEWIDDHTFIDGARMTALAIGAIRQQDDAIIDKFEQFNTLIENLTSRIAKLEKEKSLS